MKTTHTIETPLGELATRHPRASRIFRAHGIDYCCGGTRSLKQACAEAGLDAAGMLGRILDADAGPPAPSLAEAPIVEIIDTILSRYHEPLKTELPALLEMARKVEAVHQDKETAPLGLAAHLNEMTASMFSHMEKEEQVLFPMIRAGHGPRADMPIRVMMEEHDDHAANLRKLRSLATDFVPPADACTTWRALYLRLDQLEADLMEHVHLENHVLFPRALREADPRAVPATGKAAGQ